MQPAWPYIGTWSDWPNKLTFLGVGYRRSSVVCGRQIDTSNTTRPASSCLGRLLGRAMIDDAFSTAEQRERVLATMQLMTCSGPLSHALRGGQALRELLEIETLQPMSVSRAGRRRRDGRSRVADARGTGIAEYASARRVGFDGRGEVRRGRSIGASAAICGDHNARRS